MTKTSTFKIEKFLKYFANFANLNYSSVNAAPSGKGTVVSPSLDLFFLPDEYHSTQPICRSSSAKRVEHKKARHKK